MKKRTISKLRSIFGTTKKSKRHHQESSKSSRSPSPQTSFHNGELRSSMQTPPPMPSRVGPPPSPPVPTHPIAPVPPDPVGPLPLSPCPVCSRTFVPQSLSKHIKICEKMTVKKRKTFDSSRQRREGTDLEQYLPKNFGLPENSPFCEKSPPQTAKPVVKPKPSVRTIIAKPSAELSRCPHCSRTFGMRAFERHVEWCADKAKILPAQPVQQPKVSDAKQRLDARTRYKAPPVRSRRTSSTRDKSSHSRSGSVESYRGVSPPREYGDHRNPRRASESVSSNDYLDDHSPHVPVIRNTRTSLNSSSGDANVRARQARLARDLSSTSKQDSQTSLQKTNESNAKKIAQNKFKKQADLKKQEQLKKLEEIARKYEERQQMIKEEKMQKLKAAKEKTKIPKCNAKKTKRDVQVNVANIVRPVDETNFVDAPSNVTKSALHKDTVQKNDKAIEKDSNKTKNGVIRKDSIQLSKDTTMSLDSLEDAPNSASDNTRQSIGINTELLCPCKPCVIHDNLDPKAPIKRKSINEKYQSNIDESMKLNSSEPKLEFLYKNLTMVSSCDIQARHDEDSSKEDLSLSFNKPTIRQNVSDKIISAESSCNFFKRSDMDIDLGEVTKQSDTELVPDNEAQKIKMPEPTDSEEKIEYLNNLSAERFEEDYERDMSNTFDDSIENINKEDEENIGKEAEEKSKEDSEIMCRHGSGDTYTKFTENPADLEEFMSLTDKMIVSDSNERINEIERDINNFHTPKTNSLESINENNTDDNNTNSKTVFQPPVFNETFDELKNYFQALLDNTGAKIQDITKNSDITEEDNESAEKRKVSDMEHITVYELNFYEQRSDDKTLEIDAEQDDSSQIKLPSIAVDNKAKGISRCNKKRMQAIYKSNRKFKMLAEQDRGTKEYKTYIKDDGEHSDGQSISADGPPLKLPRIEKKKRYDDTYDPFASAARQMKELMSSETNIPQKIQNSSNSTRTLPILRPSREKSMSSLRADNTKMMKDSLNKTYQYQKTPTLQRMKSFGSTTNDNSYTFGSRCNSFRNKNDKKSSQQKLNTTFTKSSKENISTIEKNYFNRSSNMNRSFSSYTTSSYSTPKPKEKTPKIASSMYHSFQKSTIKQPVKLDKIATPKTEDNKKTFVNLDSILGDDNSSTTDSNYIEPSLNNSSMTDSNYIDPRLINENDNLPINVNTILNNPDIISSMESLLTTENLPSKFDSFNMNNNVQNSNNKKETSKSVESVKSKTDRIETNNNINDKLTTPFIDNLSAQYDKLMSSLEQSINSKASIKDDESVCEDFDLEEFMISFDDEVHKQQLECKRTCSSTTRVVKQAELESNKTSELNSACSSPKIVFDSNGMLPINKSTSFNFSTNNVMGDSVFPSSVKRSTSLLESIQKKSTSKTESAKSRHRADILEQDIMQSLKEFDKFYESERVESQPVKETAVYNTSVHNGTAKRESSVKAEKKQRKPDRATNGNYTPSGKSNDSAYSSLNRISPSKLSVCNSKDSNSNGQSSLDRIPAGSDSSGCQKDEVRSLSSEEFLAMERSAELEAQLIQPKLMDNPVVNDKHAGSRASSRHSTNNQWPPPLSSSSSEISLHRGRRDSAPAPPPRLSRFCHECGSKFPMDTAKFCIECGVKRLTV